MITISMVLRANWEMMKEQYQAGTTASELARRHGIPRATLVDRLKIDRVYIPERSSGVKKRNVCDAGHDMNEHGVQIWKTKTDGSKVKNGRFCSECKRIRERVT